jgi:hypothetical protein
MRFFIRLWNEVSLKYTFCAKIGLGFAGIGIKAVESKIGFSGLNLQHIPTAMQC